MPDIFTYLFMSKWHPVAFYSLLFLPHENDICIHDSYCIICLNIRVFWLFVSVILHFMSPLFCVWAGSAWRTNVWSLMVWSRWPLWVGNISTWCWLYVWTGYSCSVQPYQWADIDFKSPPACHGWVQLVSGVRTPIAMSWKFFLIFNFSLSAYIC